jgi:hypothetical protein
MRGSKPRRAGMTPGAFHCPDGIGMIPVKLRVLSDGNRDEPAEAEDSDRVLEAEPPGLMRVEASCVTTHPSRTT